MSAESLVLLCAKTACLDSRGGGKGALRPEDIALALSGLHDKVVALGLYTVVNDKSVQRQLIYYARLEVFDLAIARGWRAPAGSEVWRKMAILALCEVIGGEACSDARCEACGGSGVHRFTASEREEALGVSGRRWLARYERVYRRISAWRTTLEDHLWRRLGIAPGLAVAVAA